MGVGTHRYGGQEEKHRQQRVTGGDDAPLGVAIVFSELVQATEPVTGAELQERTLLPERTVEDALGELEGADGVHVLSPRVDNQPQRYFVRPD